MRPVRERKRADVRELHELVVRGPGDLHRRQAVERVRKQRVQLLNGACRIRGDLVKRRADRRGHVEQLTEAPVDERQLRAENRTRSRARLVQAADEVDDEPQRVDDRREVEVLEAAEKVVEVRPVEVDREAARVAATRADAVDRVA
jgi:hypothetical protein